tara:strand:- start:116 stop:286 length:171 start_codon:yes stop_codon:yes gene_type:complete
MNSLNDSLPTISFLILTFSILLISQLFQLKKEQRRLNNKVKHILNDLNKLKNEKKG